ncbi:hypothetical protein JHK84_043426 [Glycine max]|nr:hypothetical protein JHK86_043240 [Glycine max]KAG5117313.1 hypothetical protein JHK84_043426 [Glycine max]
MPALLHSSDTSNCFTNVAGETPSTSVGMSPMPMVAYLYRQYDWWEAMHRPAGGGVVPDEPGPRGLLAGRFRDPIKLLPLHVDDGQLVVLFDRFRGILNETIGEGTHFLIPWVQKPYIFDIRTHTHTFSFVSGTKDLQMVNQTLCVLSRPDTINSPSSCRTSASSTTKKSFPPSATRSSKLSSRSSTPTSSSPIAPTCRRSCATDESVAHETLVSFLMMWRSRICPTAQSSPVLWSRSRWPNKRQRGRNLW